MKIRKLHIRSFGKLSDVTIELQDEVNVIHGSNEAGKTTLSVFLFAMLFDIEKPRTGTGKDLYTRYLPWENPDDYGGELEFEHEGSLYRLKRSFKSTDHTTELYNLSEGREIYGGNRAFTEMLPGLSMNEYTSTWFQQEDSEEPDHSIAEGLKKHATEIASLNNQGIDIAYALALLDKNRREIGPASGEQKLAELKEVIAEEEATERKLDEIAVSETEGREELERLSKELEEFRQPTDFEKREQEYYTHKERFQSFKQDEAESARLSEQLEETVKLGNTLEEDSKKLETCKEELNAHRKYIRANEDECRALRGEIESMNRILLSESRSNFQKQMIMLLAAAIFIVLGVAMLIMDSHMLLWIAVFIVAVLLSGAYFLNFTRSQRRTEEKRARINEKKQQLHETEAEKERYCAENPSEEELVKRYEELLKEDGRRPEIRRKEEELSQRIRENDEKLEKRKAELLEFFKSFGGIENLKEDELKLQEEKLRAGKEERSLAIEKLHNDIDELTERLFRLRMQIENGEENAGNLVKHLEEKKILEDEILRSKNEIKAIETAAEIITELSSEDHRSFGAEINRRASSYASDFTDSRYNSFVADEALNLQVDYLDRYIPVDRLSRGTISQMKLALRMSAGDILLSDFDLPLVLDDVFVFFDDLRLSRTLSVICSHEGQKIILSCQTREERTLRKLGVNFNLVLL